MLRSSVTDEQGVRSSYTAWLQPDTPEEMAKNAETWRSVDFSLSVLFHGRCLTHEVLTLKNDEQNMIVKGLHESFNSGTLECANGAGGAVDSVLKAT